MPHYRWPSCHTAPFRAPFILPYYLHHRTNEVAKFNFLYGYRVRISDAIHYHLIRLGQSWCAQRTRLARVVCVCVRILTH